MRLDEMGSYEARDSTPGVKFKAQCSCEGWTPVTQAESRRRPEHGDGAKANPKIPEYSESGRFFIVKLTISQALLFVVERLTTNHSSPLPQVQLHHTPVRVVT